MAREGIPWQEADCSRLKEHRATDTKMEKIHNRNPKRRGEMTTGREVAVLSAPVAGAT